MGSCLSSQKSLEENAGNDPVPELAKDMPVSPKAANEELAQENTNEELETVKKEDDQPNEATEEKTNEEAEQEAVEKDQELDNSQLNVEVENTELNTNVGNSQDMPADDHKNAEEAETEVEQIPISEIKAEDVDQQNDGKLAEEKKTSGEGDEAKNAEEDSNGQMIKTNNKPSPWGKFKILPWL